MNAAFNKGALLLQHGRYELAEQEFRAALAQEPDFAAAHARLALCLEHRKDRAGAIHEAQEAVRLGAGDAYNHYILGFVLKHNGKLKLAEESALRALELEPYDADYFGLVASIALDRDHPKEALDWADQGLACEASHNWCANLRAMALVKLGKKAEASESLGAALHNNPEDSLTHANQGWTCLHQGNYKQAFEHFQESLRLDPENDWARDGLKEALKARYPFYRLVLKFSLWLNRQSNVSQVLVLIGLIVAQKLLPAMAREVPILAPLAIPGAVLLFGFVALTWVAGPLANFLLQFNRYGRLATSPVERFNAIAIGSLLMAAVLSVVCWFALAQPRAVIWAIFFALMIFPTQAFFRFNTGAARWIGAAALCGMIYLAAPLLMLTITSNAPATELMKSDAASKFPIFVACAFLSTWLPTLAESRGLVRR